SAPWNETRGKDTSEPPSKGNFERCGKGTQPTPFAGLTDHISRVRAMNEEVKIRPNGAPSAKNGARFSSELSELCISSPAKTLAALDASPAGLTEEQVEE